MNKEPAKTWQRLNSAYCAWVPWPTETNPAGVAPSKVPLAAVVVAPWSTDGAVKVRGAGRLPVHPTQEGLDFGPEPPERVLSEKATGMMEVDIIRIVDQAKSIGQLESNRPYLCYKGRDLEIEKLTDVEITPGPAPVEPEMEPEVETA